MIVSRFAIAPGRTRLAQALVSRLEELHAVQSLLRPPVGVSAPAGWGVLVRRRTSVDEGAVVAEVENLLARARATAADLWPDDDDGVGMVDGLTADWRRARQSGLHTGDGRRFLKTLR